MRITAGFSSLPLMCLTITASWLRPSIHLKYGKKELGVKTGKTKLVLICGTGLDFPLSSGEFSYPLSDKNSIYFNDWVYKKCSGLQ